MSVGRPAGVDVCEYALAGPQFELYDARCNDAFIVHRFACRKSHADRVLCEKKERVRIT